jgi:hypothetical protein
VPAKAASVEKWLTVVSHAEQQTTRAKPPAWGFDAY